MNNRTTIIGLLVIIMMFVVGCGEEKNVSESVGAENENSERNEYSENIGTFDANEGLGGLASGGFEENSVHPTNVGWTRQSRFKGPDNPVIKAEIDLPGILKSQRMEPTIDNEGNIYIRTNDREPENDGIFKFDRDGNEVWRQTDYHEEYDVIPGNAENRATILTKDNQLITTLNAKHVAGVDMDTGEFNFVFEVEGNLGTDPWEPAIGDDGTIYFVYDQNLVALDSDGNEQWRYTNDGGDEDIGVTYTPVVTHDRIYVRDWYDLTVFDLEGNILWTENIGHVTRQDQSNIIVDNEENIYFAHRERLVSYDKDGELLWDVVVDEEEDVKFSSSYHGLALSEEGHLIGFFQPHVYAFDLEGNKVWKSERLFHFGEVTVDSEGISYVAGRGIIFAFDKEGNIKWEFETSSSYGGAVVIGPNEELIVAVEASDQDKVLIIGNE